MNHALKTLLFAAGLTVSIDSGVIAQDPAVADAARQAMDAMKEAKRKLAEADGAAAVGRQRLALEQLDRLIDAAGQGGGEERGDQSDDSPMSPTPNPDAKPGENTPKPGPGNEPSQPAQTTVRDREDAQDSTERNDPRQAKTVTAARRRRLETAVWGHLPEKVREEFLNSYNERMLPGYEDLIRQYYNALSESEPKR